MSTDTLIDEENCKPTLVQPVDMDTPPLSNVSSPFLLNERFFFFLTVIKKVSTTQTSPATSEKDMETIKAVESGLSETIVEEEVLLAQATLLEQENRMKAEVRKQNKKKLINQLISFSLFNRHKLNSIQL